MSIVLARGGVAVRECVEEHLRTKVPELVDQARIAWNMSAERLPYPKRYDAWDPYDVQEYPIVGAYVQRTRDFRRINNSSIGSPYRPIYSLSVAVWCEDPRYDGVKFRDPTAQGAIRVASDLTAILRAALLEFPNLGRPDVFTFEEDTYAEEYVPAQKAMSEDNWVAAGVLSFSMHVNEHNLLLGSVLGTVEDALLTVDSVGPAQLFPETV